MFFDWIAFFSNTSPVIAHIITRGGHLIFGAFVPWNIQGRGLLTNSWINPSCFEPKIKLGLFRSHVHDAENSPSWNSNDLFSVRSRKPTRSDKQNDGSRNDVHTTSFPPKRERERKEGGGGELPFTVILLVHAPYLLSVGISLVFYSVKWLFWYLSLPWPVL